MKNKKKDTHVLDWEKIQKHANVDLDNNHATNKGVLFEDLIEKLLISMFPEETWKRTGKSHDGKRDFVYPAEAFLPEQKWAECKNYNTNLSINIIAPTLIMGAIKNIACIFFFSFSPLNDTAIENLLRYSEMKGTVIKIYDGNFLESLICKYYAVGEIKAFFPNTDFIKAYAELETKQLRIVKTLYDLNGNKVPLTHRFELGELFYFHVIVQNLTWKPLKFEISFSSSNPRIAYCKDYTSIALLSFEGIDKYSALFEAINPGSTSCTVRIKVNGKIKTFTEKITVIDEPYLAWSGEDALQALIDGQQHLEEKNLQPLLIVGKSGTGKSTLTEILLQQRQIQRLYTVLKIDLSLSRNNCMRNIFSQIFGIRGKEITPKEQEGDDEATLSILASNYAESAEMIAHIMMEFYNPSRPYLLVVDDIQKINRQYLSLLQELDSHAKEKEYIIHYLFALNDEEISLNELLSCLNWDINYQNREYRIIRTSEFRKEDILAYMKTRYGLVDIDQYFNDDDMKINPLELHSFCVGLKKEHIIAKIPGSKVYHIINPFRFNDGIQKILYANISLKNICNLLDKGGQAEFLLKYLYLTDMLSFNMESRYFAIIHKLIDQGILREKEGFITFYHEKIRTVVSKTLTFSEEDYADIFSDRDTDDVAKAICALEQIGRLRNGTLFLKNFFSSNINIRKGLQRHHVCKLIFQHLGELSDTGLLAIALQFVRQQFDDLKEEEGHKTFFRFLNLIADSALENNWDIDEVSIENMAFFIKKFFDRALSTYNHQSCLEYFQNYKKIFNGLRHISNSRRNFWLAHYANRAAIALDRESNPLTVEPAKVTELYALSEFYSNEANEYDQLILQVTVDNFNRHYVYRHNLTIDYIHNIYADLLKLKEKGITDSMVLDYHLLLLKYLYNQMMHSDIYDLQELLNQIRNTYKKSNSAFYIIKLYIMEITILISLYRWEEATEHLSQAINFAYKKEMRSYIYKLTYIKTHLIIFEKGTTDSLEVYQQAVLALEQLIDTHGNAGQNLKREIFLLVRLMEIIVKNKHSEISELIRHSSQQVQELLQAVYAHIQGKPCGMEKLLNMQSYYLVQGISFPIM